MTQKPNQANPEKLMLLLFPLITLSLFLLGVVGYSVISQIKLH
jgi:hypothetical protein